MTLVDINKSSYDFEPDAKNNQILFGMKALNGVGTQVIDSIIKNRPYTSFKDYLQKNPTGKTAMISLIKSGAFDSLEAETASLLNIHPRIFIMAYYLSLTSEPKKKLTLSNFNGLIEHDLIPAEFDFHKRVFKFNKYLKKFFSIGEYYSLQNEQLLNFFTDNFDEKFIAMQNEVPMILQKDWDKLYKKTMEEIKIWINENEEKLLNDYNYILFKNEWGKYAKGTLSYWEMEALCFYYHPHELSNIKVQKYGIVNFFNLPETPVVDYFFRKTIPVYKLQRIAGTVIGKDDVRSSVTLLTLEGVVNVKFTKEYYAMFNRQISEIQTDGTKKVKEKSWFTRGTKIIVSGFRREDTFVGKTYKNTPFHQLYKITEIKDGELTLCHERYQGEEAPNE